MPNTTNITAENFTSVFAAAGVTPVSTPAPAQTPAKSSSGTFDINTFVARHFPDAQEEPYNGGRKFLLKVCPFNQDHNDGSAVIVQLAGGALSFKCHHNGCIGKQWHDVRAMLEPKQARTETTRQRSPQVLDENIVQAIEYQRITAAELDSGNFELEYIAEDFYVAAQPQIWAGGKKNLKTNGLLEFGICAVSGKPVFNKFAINRQVRVAVMTGESGMATIQETCRRICRAKELDLAKLEGLIFSPDLPRIEDVNHQEALRRWLRHDDIEVLILDPAYLCLPGDDAGNLFMQGAMLRNLTEVCSDVGTGLILAHHTKKNLADPFQPPELEDISWAGFQEFARQWVLLSRRKGYDPDNAGHHELWLSCGGSAGHSSLWALNIDEGSPKDPGGRRWQVELITAKDARRTAQEQHEQAKQQTKDLKHEAKVKAALEGIQKALRSVPDNQETISRIRQLSGHKGAIFDEAFGELLRLKKLQPVTIERANKQTYEGFKYVFE